VRADAHTIAVERMQLGDHAFAHYADDDVRWEVAALFANRGLVFSGMRELISPEKSFTARRQLDRLRRETEVARQEGSPDCARSSTWPGSRIWGWTSRA
jgi:hypothetical protein